MQTLPKTDPEIAHAIRQEMKRQQEGLVLIASENYTSVAVREAVGSSLENKYAEGYPRKRYYTGNAFVDDVETICIERAQKLFGVPFANVQPYSGSPANLEIMAAVAGPGGLSLSQELSHGGHLSMGQSTSFTSKYFTAVHYHLTKDGEVDFEELETLAKKHRPKIIWSGGTGYTRVFQWERYARIADMVGAYFVADISHIAGLVAGGAHPSPVPYAHIVMTTTHKTLRGPRGAMILVTEKGMQKDPELPKKINFAVFPGHQGGPHMNKIAGIAVALKEAADPLFGIYAHQIVKNSKALAGHLLDFGFTLIGGGSDNHMIWIDLSGKKIDGWQAHMTLEAAAIYGNKQTVPYDAKTPYYPSGYRIGTPATTTRGMKEAEMKTIADCINRGVSIAQNLTLPGIGSPDRETDQKARKTYKEHLAVSRDIQKLRKDVSALCKHFPLP